MGTRTNRLSARDLPRALAATALCAATLLGAATAPAHAQDVQRIAAVVNDQVISVFDLGQRMQLLVVQLGIRDPSDRQIQGQLQRMAMNDLIEEALQTQEAARLNIRVSQPELDAEIARIERALEIPAGGFGEAMRRQGIAADAAIRQIRAALTWQKLAARTVVPTIQISEEEIDEVVARQDASEGVTEYRVAEIFLPVDDPAAAPDIRSLALRLVEQLRQGANFPAMAQQFSKSASAAAGGDIGWIQPGELDPAVDAVIASLPERRISDPIEIPEGILIATLLARRTNEPPDPGERIVRLRQLLLPLDDGAPQAEIDAQIQAAGGIASSVRGCEEFVAAAQAAGAPQPGAPGGFRIKDLSPRIGKLAAELPVGQASEPIRTPDGIQILMICARQEHVGPDRNQIRAVLRGQRTDMLLRRYIRDLRRSAYIEKRV